MDSCICMFGHQGPTMNIKPNQDQFIIDVYVSTVSISHDPSKPFWNLEKSSWSSKQTLEYSREAFLASTTTEQYNTISNIIQGLKFPFVLENDIHWGLKFPQNNETSLNLDEIVTELVKVACRCAENNQKGNMGIRIRKLDRVTLEDYHKLCDAIESKKVKQPSDDHIMENMCRNNVTCRRVLFDLYRKSPPDNKYFGLKAIKLTGSERYRDRCSICLSELRKDTEAIELPCSHIFHGHCVFGWIGVKPTCPLCQLKLF